MTRGAQIRPAWTAAVAWGTILAVLVPPCPAATYYAQPETSVEAGRAALDRWWDYDWYDADADGVARIDIQPPRPRPDLSWLGDTIVVAGWTALAALVAVLIYLLVRVFLDRAGNRQRDIRVAEALAERTRIDRIETLPPPVRQAAADLLGEARRHYQAGNFGEAMIYLFSHQLVELDKAQIIHLSRGKTNRQYLSEARSRSTLDALFEPVMVAFEDVFFGNHRLDRNRFERCWNRLDEFHRLAAQGATR